MKGATAERQHIVSASIRAPAMSPLSRITPQSPESAYSLRRRNVQISPDAYMAGMNNCATLRRSGRRAHTESAQRCASAVRSVGAGAATVSAAEVDESEPRLIPPPAQQASNKITTAAAAARSNPPFIPEACRFIRHCSICSRNYQPAESRLQRIGDSHLPLRGLRLQSVPLCSRGFSATPPHYRAISPCGVS